MKKNAKSDQEKPMIEKTKIELISDRLYVQWKVTITCIIVRLIKKKFCHIKRVITQNHMVCQIMQQNLT